MTLLSKIMCEMYPAVKSLTMVHFAAGVVVGGGVFKGSRKAAIPGHLQVAPFLILKEL